MTHSLLKPTATGVTALFPFVPCLTSLPKLFVWIVQIKKQMKISGVDYNKLEGCGYLPNPINPL